MTAGVIGIGIALPFSSWRMAIDDDMIFAVAANVTINSFHRRRVVTGVISRVADVTKPMT